VHCFAHQLQLALVVISKDVREIWQLYSNLNVIINFLSASPKCYAELNSAQEIEIAHKVATGKLNIGRRCNQVCTLQRAGATRWSSHFVSVTRLIEIFEAASTVLENIIDNAIDFKVCLEADSAYNAMISFDFVFALHLL